MTARDHNWKPVEGPACDPHVRRSDGSQASLRFFDRDCGPGQRVLDVGCGSGEHLRILIARGCDAVGVDRDPQILADLKRQGLAVVAGRAEQLPFPNASFDAVICSVVVPYTDERRTIAEWSRILKPQGQVRASYHGLGYFLNYLLRGPGLRLRVYGARAIANGWTYALCGKRLPGFWGDTLYQSVGRLRNYYRRQRLRLVREYVRPGLFGLRDIFFHHLEKTD